MPIDETPHIEPPAPSGPDLADPAEVESGACLTDWPSSTDNDEANRLLALARTDLLDTAPEQPFEATVDLVRQVLQVPICAVSLIDRDRQWFKAQRGLDVSETARDISFCTHAIKAAGPYVVEDALSHPLFQHNPLVTGGPKIRSYAGIPLTTFDGYAIGTLCVIDHVPRKFSVYEITALASFAKLLVCQIEMRQIAASGELPDSENRPL